MVVSLHRRRGLLAFLLAAVLLAGMANMGIHWMKAVLYPRNYRAYVEKYCDAYSVDENLAYAVIHTESGFHSDAVSHMGACGLMQLMPETFEWLGSKLGADGQEDIFDPETNIRYGIYFLSLLHDEFGDERLAIAAYHAGMGRVNQWLGDVMVSPDGRTLERIPFSDTEHYVRKVERAKRVYETLYQDNVTAQDP